MAKHIKTDNDLIDMLVSYADGQAMVMNEKKFTSIRQLKDWALDFDVECCPNCLNWVNSYELVDNNDNIDGYCDNCRPHRDD